MRMIEVGTGAAPDIAEIAAQARRLAADGRFRQAIDLMADQDPDAIEADLLGELMHWRASSFEPEAGQPSWPRAYADPFPGAPGPPEIEAGRLSETILGGAIQHHGCLLVRGLTTPEQTDHLASVTRSAFATALSPSPPDLVSPLYRPCRLDGESGLRELGRQWSLSVGGLWTGDSPRAFADLIAALKRQGVIEVIDAYLGERAFLSLGKSTLRKVQPDSATDWHQDGSFLGPAIRTVNVWLALTDCGRDAPGLDLFPRRLSGLAETGTHGALFDWSVGEKVLEGLGAPVVTPDFRAGDALLFDQLFLHRTGIHPGMTRERLAIESWFFAGSTFPMEQGPLAI
jgi:Phytanoyl-CoA dioxygenase (PhyH)